MLKEYILLEVIKQRWYDFPHFIFMYNNIFECSINTLNKKKWKRDRRGVREMKHEKIH